PGQPAYAVAAAPTFGEHAVALPGPAVPSAAVACAVPAGGLPALHAPTSSAIPNATRAPRRLAGRGEGTPDGTVSGEEIGDTPITLRRTRANRRGRPSVRRSWFAGSPPTLCTCESLARRAVRGACLGAGHRGLYWRVAAGRDRRRAERR